MNCKTVLKFMDAYMDGELEADMMLKIESHMDDCPSCSAVFQLKKRIKKEVYKHCRTEAPEHLKEKVEANIVSGWRFSRSGSIAVFAAAAVVLVAFGWTYAGSDEGDVGAVLDDVVERHVRPLPMEFESQNGRNVANWFQGKVDFPVRPLGAKVKNVSFRGARLSNVREHQAAHMTYLVDGHKVTFMVFPSANLAMSGGDIKEVKGRKYLIGRRNGYNVAMFRDGDMVYALSSELPAEKLVSCLSRR